MPSARSGRGVGRVDMDAVAATGRAAGALGEGITTLGASIQQTVDQDEEREVQRRLLEFEQAQSRALDESRRTLTGDPAGFADRTRATFTDAGRGMFAGAQEAGLSPRALTRLAYGLSGLRDRVQTTAFGAELGQRGAYGEQWVTERLNALTQDYQGAPDDEARQRILDSAERTIALGRQTYGFSTETEQRLRGTARQMIEHDILSRPDGYSALMELRSGDPRVRAPSTGEISDTQLQRLVRRPGMTPEQLQEAVAGLRTQSGEISRLIREGLTEGVSLTQAQHDALVSFGLARGADALQELMPTVNSSGPGRLSSLAQAMRTPGGLRAMEEAGLTPGAGQTPPTTPPSGPGRPVPRFAPEVDSAIAAAAERHGVDPDLMRRIAAIESSGDPRAVTGSYRGLFQLSEQEFAGRGDILSPADNAEAAAANFVRHIATFRQQHGRDPTAGELYLIHQQGVGGFAAHMAEPSRLAWQSMLATGEGRRRGEAWARQAIGGNLPPRVLAQLGGIENVTSQQFMDYWRGRVEGAAPGGQASPGAPSADPRIAELADLVQGNAPAGRYASLPADRRRWLVEQLSRTLRPEVAAEIERDIESIRQTGEPRRLPDGSTWIDRAPHVLPGMQAARIAQRVAEARAQFQAIYGLTDMAPDDMSARLDQIDPVGDAEDGTTPRTRRFVAGVIRRITDLRRTDPALWASGTFVVGQGTSQRMGENGQIHTIPAEDDLRVQPATEVSRAYELLSRRRPDLQIQIRPDGSITAAPAEGQLNPADARPQTLLLTDPRLSPEDRRIIIDARLAAMARVGVLEHDRRLLRADEAAVLLGMPARASDMGEDEFQRRLREAADRAVQLFGPQYARAAFNDAWHFRRLTGQSRADAVSIGQSLPGGFGEGMTPDELGRLMTLRRGGDQLSREEALWRYGAPSMPVGTPFGPLMGVTAPPTQPPGWFGSSPGPQVPPPLAPSASSPSAPSARATGVPGVSAQAWPRPSPEDIQDLVADPRTFQHRFDSEFGPGSAARYLQMLQGR